MFVILIIGLFFSKFVQFCYVWRFYFRWHRLVEVPAYVFSLLYVASEIQNDGKTINIAIGSRYAIRPTVFFLHSRFAYSKSL